MWNKIHRVTSGAHQGASKIPVREEGGLCVTVLLMLRNLKQRSGDSATESRQLPQWEGTQPPLPQSRCQERRLGTTAGTWARPQHCASSARPAAPGLAAVASGERFLPFCSAPVRGNLWSVTRILQRATCSPGCAAGTASQTGPAVWVPRAPEAMRALARRSDRLPLLGKAPRSLSAPGEHTSLPPRTHRALPLPPHHSPLSLPLLQTVNLASVRFAPLPTPLPPLPPAALIHSPQAAAPGIGLGCSASLRGSAATQVARDSQTQPLATVGTVRSHFFEV